MAVFVNVQRKATLASPPPYPFGGTAVLLTTWNRSQYDTLTWLQSPRCHSEFNHQDSASDAFVVYYKSSKPQSASIWAGMILNQDKASHVLAHSLTH